MPAGLATLLAVLLMQDPAVTYREGLFEEIDQSNPAKALELYARVLKADAPVALKAKALFRQGCCHEQLGKPEAAEPLFREVVEKFASERETARLAADRLRGKAGSVNAVFGNGESEIERLIVEMGSAEQWGPPARKLGLLGDPSIPHLRKALSHRDALLCGRVATVLLEMEQFDGLYDAFKRSIERPGKFDGSVLAAWGRLLKARPEDYERFIREFPQFESAMITELNFLQTWKEPRLLPLLERAILKDPGLLGNRMSIVARWCELAGPADAVRLVRELLSREPISWEALEHVFSRMKRIEEHQKPNDALDRLLRETLSRMKDQGPFIMTVMEHRPHDAARSIISFVSPETVVEVYQTWLKNPSRDVRANALSAWAWIKKSPKTRQGITALLLAALNSPDFPQDLKEAILSQIQSYSGLTPPQELELDKYRMSFLKSLEKVTPLAPEQEDSLDRFIEQLVLRLPLESDDMKWIVGMILRRQEATNMVVQWHRKGDVQHREGFREVIVAAALEILGRSPSPEVVRNALHIIEGQASPAERLRLAGSLASLSADHRKQALGMLVAAIRSIHMGKEHEAFLDGLPGLLPKLSEDEQYGILSQVASQPHPALDRVFDEAYKASSLHLRILAVNYWTTLKRPRDLPLILQALKDPADPVKVRALNGIGEESPLQLVPELIALLDSASEDVRAGAQGRLEAIKKYQERKLQWRRWYDEVKKLEAK